MCGDVPLRLLHSLVTWTGKNLPFKIILKVHEAEKIESFIQNTVSSIICINIVYILS